MPGHIADTFRKIALGTVAIAIVLMSAAGAYAIEPFLQGFSAPVGIHAYGDTSLLVSNWSGGTVERVQADGTRSIFLDNIMSPAGIAIDAAGVVYVSSYSGDIIVGVGPDGKRRTVADGLATPTGIAFARDGRLLIANRSSGEIVAFDTKTGNAPWWRVGSRCLSAWSKCRTAASSPRNMVVVSPASCPMARSRNSVRVSTARRRHPRRWR
jgi:outer membrane protein assembly factor BamB